MVHVKTPRRPVSMSLVAGRAHYDTVIPRVIGATTSVWIATANVKDLMIAPDDLPKVFGRRARRYTPAIDLFGRLCDRGVELRLLHARLPSRSFRDTFDKHKTLVKGGLELRQCPRLHLKTVIVDGEFMYLGSANWTGAGIGVRSEHKRNFELGIVTSDASWIDQVQAMYQSIWSGEPCSACKLKDRCEAPLL